MAKAENQTFDQCVKSSSTLTSESVTSSQTFGHECATSIDIDDTFGDFVLVLTKTKSNQFENVMGWEGR